MTIAEWGSIGELVAAVATLATLAYLALQIRQSNRSHQLAAVARIGESTESWLAQLIADPELLELYVRGLTGNGSMTREERARFNLLVIQFLRGTESGWLQVQWGVVDPDYWDGYRESVRVIVGSGAGRRAFHANKAVLTRRFAEEIEEIIGEEAADPRPERP